MNWFIIVMNSSLVKFKIEKKNITSHPIQF